MDGMMSGARLVLLALPAASRALLVNAPSAGVQVARPVKTALAVEQIEEQLERGRMVLGRTRDMPLVALTKKNNPGILLSGGSLRTWSYRAPSLQRVQVLLNTAGRPLDASVELWSGPDNTPVKMRVYAEDGQLRPFSTVVETPRGANTVAVLNLGTMELPLTANVVAENVDAPSAECVASRISVQGGAIRTFPFGSSVESVQVLLRTDGRPLNARIELLQGPNNNKQVVELYTEDGCDRPFFCILETPGSGNVVRIVNTAPVEFPMTAGVVPHSINDYSSMDAVLGGDVVIGGDVGF
uniref:Uncharacterized protein n=1 Tax=Haptolina ericina TaxID=156174 RepID=A0A7S3AMJ8_9EUKA